MFLRLSPAFLLPLLLAAVSVAAASFQPDLLTLDRVPRVSLPTVAVAKALDTAPRKDRPFRFAVGVATDFTLAHGAWDTLPDGTRRWRLRLDSPGAKSLNLNFKPFELPAGAALWIYAVDGALVQGPWSAANATPSGLWTPIIPQDSLVIEVQVPALQASQLRLGVTQAFHGYRDWKNSDGSTKAGSCNVDVACPTDGVWADEMRAVGNIHFGGQFFCTGQLLNNTLQNLEPLFLTADHCRIGPDEGDISADSVVVYWNYQTNQCRGSRNGSLNQTQTGSTFLADDAKADFTLLRLASTPDPTYGVYYAGWNAVEDSGNPAYGSNCGVGIHHPNGDEKAISFFTTPLQSVLADIDNITVQAWKVTRWAFGTTESGSSGSGLWNQRHELIGVLSGGNASCTNRSGSDFYGRLNHGWEPAGSTSAGQLKIHLDPGGLLTADNRHIPGREPTAPPVADLGTVTSTRCGSAGVNIPFSKPDTYTTPIDTPLTVPAPGVLANDGDSDGDAITAVLDSTTTSGTLSLSDNGSFSYTPNSEFMGMDTFRYHATDGQRNSPGTTVTIAVGQTVLRSGGGALGAVLLVPLLLGAALRSRG